MNLYVSDLGNFGMGGSQSASMSVDLYISSNGADLVQTLSQSLALLVSPQLTVTEGEGVGYVRFDDLLSSSSIGRGGSDNIYYLNIRTDSNEILNTRGDGFFNISVQAVVNIPFTTASRINITYTSEIDTNLSSYSTTMAGSINDILLTLKSSSFITLPQYFHGAVNVLFTISSDNSAPSTSTPVPLGPTQGVSSTIVIVPLNNPPILNLSSNTTQNIYTYDNGTLSDPMFAVQSGIPVNLPLSIHDPDISFLQSTDFSMCGNGYCSLIVSFSCVGCFFIREEFPLGPISLGTYILFWCTSCLRLLFYV